MDPMYQMTTEGESMNVSRIFLIRKFSHMCNNYKFHAFNKTGQRMIVGCDWNFKIFNLIGQLKILRRIEFIDNVGCMVFSKNLNWFATGNRFETITTIRCWKEQSNGEWLNTLPKQLDKKHASRVSCLILNNNEDQLISASFDKTIIIWKVNCQTNQFEYDYILDNKHTNSLECITINESETHLLSSSQSEIVLWEKIHKWEFKTKIVNFNFEVKICFLSNNLFVKQQIEDYETQIYQIQKGNLIKICELNLKHNRESFNTFPILLNQKKQIIISRVHHLIFICQLQEGVLKVVQDPINLQKDFGYGKIMEHGEIFVIQCQKEFRLYKIQYR